MPVTTKIPDPIIAPRLIAVASARLSEGLNPGVAFSCAINENDSIRFVIYFPTTVAITSGQACGRRTSDVCGAVRPRSGPDPEIPPFHHAFPSPAGDGPLPLKARLYHLNDLRF